MRAEYFFSPFLYFLFLLVLSAGCGYVGAYIPSRSTPFHLLNGLQLQMLFALFIILTFLSSPL